MPPREGRVPYRLDIAHPPDGALDTLVHLGALDVEASGAGLAAIMPDGVAPETVARALGVSQVAASAAHGRDDGSVWRLNPGIVRAGGVLIAPVDADAPAGALRLTDSATFGSGLHPTTALCLDALDEALSAAVPDTLLDVGTGSGILALAALLRGVPRAVGIDIELEALAVAAQHARLNGLEHRVRLVLGGVDAVEGTWPLIAANVLAAPLIEMAPVLVRRVAHRGRLILSGIPSSVSSEVERAYRRFGMHSVRTESRGGWTVIVLDASW